MARLTWDETLDWAARHWRGIVLAAWLCACAWMLYQRWTGIHWFALPDTDDNLRMAQVRAWLSGQDWFDLRQYRLDPPAGANIHWSRIVDLPIAGLILLGRLFTSGANAERIAVAVAPLLPYLVLGLAIALSVRRLIAPAAFVVALGTLFFAGSTNGMFMPLRIDHHGWQIALLAVVMAGLADPKPARGGVTAGLASALSLSIGLEMLIYLAIAAGAQVLMWVDDPGQRRRVAGYGVSLAGGTALGFLLFASYANRSPVCDALSPVWLSDALLGGALLAILAWWLPAGWARRLIGAAAAGVLVAAFHAFAWPHCLSRLEGVSPEVQRLWLDNVREAKPLYEHSQQVILLVATLPIIGVFGWLALLWRNRSERDLFRRTLAPAAVALASALLLLWQTRAGPAAQMLAIPGAAAVAWILLPLAWRARNPLLFTFGTAGAVLLGFGAAAPLARNFLPAPPPTAREQAINRANRLCPSLAAMRPVAMQPRGTIFTFVDLAPRVIAVTRHNSIAGPYHRNGEAIGDVMKAFRGDAANARALIVGKHRAEYVLICPMMSQATVFMAAAPRGFYAQLASGRVPAWLQPVDLGRDSPLQLWRVVG
jgi:hypothetical protein